MKPHPSCYNGAMLKKLVVFLGGGHQCFRSYNKLKQEGLRFSTIRWDAVRKVNIFIA